MPRFVIALFLSLVALVPATSMAQETPKPLKVALYRYVPNPDGIEEVIRNKWKAHNPTVKVEFVKWDCYTEDPPEDIDVFEFDSIMLDYFVRNNFVSPLRAEDINNRDDLYDFAARGSMVDGVYYAIPRIACTPVIIYRKDDTAIRDAKGLKELAAVIGENDTGESRPPKGKGLLIDLTGGTTCACYYLDGIADKLSTYSVSPRLPEGDRLDEEVIGTLRLLTKMAGKAQADDQTCVGKHAEWFAAGHGRAFVGWTERLTKLPTEMHKDLAVRPLPLASSNAVNLVYVDMLAVNARLEGQRRSLALEFANLASSREVVMESFLTPDPATKNPQYLLPVRKSIVDDEAFLKAAPMYKDISFVLTERPKAFRLGSDVRQWLAATKKKIRGGIVSTEK